jgi:hypothetical protein
MVIGDKPLGNDGGPGRVRADDLFHVMEVKDLPAIDSKGAYDRRSRPQPA